MKSSVSEELLTQGERSQDSSDQAQKFPIRRLQPAIIKFQKVLEIDLERLQKHRNNIDRLVSAADWPGLHKEQVNASRTVQQVKATVRELERTRAQVYPEELQLFDRQLLEAKERTLAAVEAFMLCSQGQQAQPTAPFSGAEHVDSRESFSLPACLDSPQSAVNRSLSNEEPVGSHDQYSASRLHSPASVPLLQDQIEPLRAVPENSQAAASGEELLKDMEELNDLVHHFADLVKEQGEGVDRIEDNIDQARDKVREGTRQLGKAAIYKAFMFPVMGAVIGAAVAGPVGFVAGGKLGIASAAGLGGGLAGFTGGKMMKNRQNKVVSMELKNLSEKDSSNGQPPKPSSP